MRELMRKVRKRYVAFNTNQAPPKKSLEVAVTPVGYVRPLETIPANTDRMQNHLYMLVLPKMPLYTTQKELTGAFHP